MRWLVTKIKKQKTIFIAALFLCVIATNQVAYDKLQPPFTTKLEAVRRNLLPSALLPYTHFGFRLFLADMYWIQAIQDYVSWNNKDGFFLEYFRNISTLDPKFEHPYHFAIWTVPSNKNVRELDDVASIVQRGMDALPENWQMPYQLGTQYYLFTKTYDKAKEYLKIAAEKKNAPLGVYLNYSSFVINEVKGYKASYNLVKVIYDSTSDETLKKVLEAGLEKEVILTMLERGILAYKTTHGKYPTSVEDLKDDNLVSLPSAFLEKFSVTINSRSGAFKIEEKR